MLGYEWANPAATLLSYDPSGEEPAQEQPHHPRHQMLPLYDRSCLDLAGTLFPSPPPPTVPLTAPSGEADYSVHHYGAVSLPPAPAPPPAAMRIGLNLGVRTYFSSSPDGELMRLGRNVYRRSSGDAGGGVLGALGGSGGIAVASRARCQAEGCGADLTRAKHYHRRHKVCEYHSKAAAVVVHGLTQRFCQQCSRFHVLSEFDQGKRSCRKRLADHNHRRRKTQPLPALLPPPQSQSGANTAASDTSPPKVADEKPSAEDTPLGICDGTPVPAAVAALAAPSSATWMALGRCLRSSEGVPGANSSSSLSATSSSSLVLQHLADFRSYDRRVSMSIWDAGTHNEHGHWTADG